MSAPITPEAIPAHQNEGCLVSTSSICRSRTKLSWRDILNLGIGEHSVAEKAAQKFGCVEVYSPAENFRKLVLRREEVETGACPDSNSTITSTSLTGPKSSRRTEPKSARLRYDAVGRTH